MSENITAFDKLTNLADAIRNKTGATGALTLDQMTQEVQNFQGGGIELNYKVISKQPDIPTENTIWVETENTITKYAFSVNNPWVTQIETELTGSLTQVEGYFSDTGAITAQNSTNKEVYIEEYIPVHPTREYAWTYTLSASKSMWFSIMEYDSSYNILGTRIEKVNSVTGTEKTGTYTPSAGNVKYVRLTWRTFGLENTVTFSGLVDFTDPEEVEGAVWFRTTYYSYADFNALPANQLQVYPVQAKQYIDGKWVELNCYTFKNGDWEQWVPYGALYWFGNLCEPTIGSWIPVNLRPNSSSSSEIYHKPTITNTSDYIIFEWVNTIWGGGGARVEVFQDLTDVSLIRIDFEGSVLVGDALMSMGVYATESVNNSDSVATMALGDYNNSNNSSFAAGTTIPRQTRELDVSALTGMHGIRFFCWDSWSSGSSQCTLKVYSLTKVYE